MQAIIKLLLCLKHTLFILAFAGILFHNFSKLIVYINFECNKTYIAKTLCVKKDVINNTCKGNCHLNKQLAAIDKQEEIPSSNNLKETREFQLFHHTFLFHLQAFYKVQQLCFVYKLPHFISPTFSIFHPPQC